MTHINLICAFRVLLLILLSGVAFSQQPRPCKDAEKYEEPSFFLVSQPLVLSGIQGRTVIEVEGKTLANDEPDGVCLSLFTADSHKFVSSTTIDHSGHFNFGDVLPGNYRLIARANGFCTGSTGINIKGSKTGGKRRSIIVYFRTSGLDVCTTAAYDRK